MHSTVHVQNIYIALCYFCVFFIVSLWKQKMEPNEGSNGEKCGVSLSNKTNTFHQSCESLFHILNKPRPQRSVPISTRLTFSFVVVITSVS